MLINTTDSPPGSAVPRFVVPNLREADPCRLIDPHVLDTFGAGQHTTPPWLESCEYIIKIREGGNARLRLQFHKPGWGDAEYTNRVGIYWGAAGCQNLRKPATNLSISITTFTYERQARDLCSVTTAITTSAEKIIDDLGGIPATPDRTSGYSHASYNACDTLDDTDFGKFGLAPVQPIPGLPTGPVPGAGRTAPTSVSGSDWVIYIPMTSEHRRHSSAQRRHSMTPTKKMRCLCRHQPRDRVTAEMFHVSVEGTVAASRCDAATAFATTVEANLS
jgi:hypothetical protein